MKPPPPFKTEADLCAAFIAAIGPNWTAYAETEGWDILLVRKADGFQIGVEAKLKLNAKVISQALEHRYATASPGPDCRAVLVPEGAGELATIAAYIGVTVVTMHKHSGTSWGPKFSPGLPDEATGFGSLDCWHELVPAARHRLPEYVPDVAAGASAPLQLTRWKVAAIKIAVILERRGYVTRHDFKAIDIDIRRWLPREQGWLAADPRGFTAGPHLPDFRQQHPRVYAEIAADAEKWMPAEVPGLFKPEQKVLGL